MWKTLLLPSLVIAFISTSPVPESTKNCGYQSCHPTKEGYINVHIVPHTHDDVGWVQTVDQYFNFSVYRIIDSVVEALAKDPNRRFIYVEMAYFWRWWTDQNDTVKAQVRKYVDNGQLEFISGGWSMNDEATTHYQSIIDQMTWGMRKLNDSFGECGRPKMGWQIDPFGHSREMASIFAQLGFDGVLLGRIDYQDKDFRLKTKTLETVWRSSQNLGESSDIFTGILYNVYWPPPGFCFDVHCHDESIDDDKNSSYYNVDERVNEFFDYVKDMTKAYTTSNVLVTMGNDFTYEDAESWFGNLDKLIFYANQRQKSGSKYNLIYSTPSCYVNAIHEETKGKKKWSVKQDDFFPYGSDEHSFWTGYFTSRPTLKRYEREGNNYLQVCKQLYALTALGPQDKVDLDVMREAMGVLQHHDAVSGTEQRHVAYDYAKQLSKGFDQCDIIAATALSKIVTASNDKSHHIQFNSCPLLNVSQCHFTETRDAFVVTVYNPLSRPVTKFVRLPVTGTSYTVTDPNGKQLTTQLIPIAAPIIKVPGRSSNATIELTFVAKDLPSLGFRSYYVEKIKGNSVLKPQKEGFDSKEETTFEISNDTGLLKGIRMNGQHLPVTQNFYHYKGFVGGERSSGAYAFRPKGPAVPASLKAVTTTYKGPLVNEVRQVFNDWISQIIRIYADESYVEFDWLVGPMPTDDGGKEVISRFTTPLKTNSEFYTDSNGREMLKRKRDSRPTWNVTLEEPIAGNYYPVTSKIAITDGSLEFAVLTDRAEGGSSLKDGDVELMVHRACLRDDGFGVGEALIEEAFGQRLVARGSHYVVLGSKNTSNPDGRTVAAQERDLAQQKLLSTWTFLSDTQGLTFEKYKKQYKMEFAGLKSSLPNNVQILTLEPWLGHTFLLRLEHVLEKNEDPNLSKSAVVDLKDLFSMFQITSVRETTLGANQWLSDNHRLHFDTAGNLEDLPKDVKSNIDASDVADNLKVTLTPMQIRTFLIDIKITQV